MIEQIRIEKDPELVGYWIKIAGSDEAVGFINIYSFPDSKVEYSVNDIREKRREENTSAMRDGVAEPWYRVNKEPLYSFEAAQEMAIQYFCNQVQP